MTYFIRDIVAWDCRDASKRERLNEWIVGNKKHVRGLWQNEVGSSFAIINEQAFTYFCLCFGNIEILRHNSVIVTI